MALVRDLIQRAASRAIMEICFCLLHLEIVEDPEFQSRAQRAG